MVQHPDRAAALLLALSVLVALRLAPGVGALNNGVGKTPAMGWNSWNFFRCNINDTLIRQVADAMVATGLRDAGYKYVNLDDCWMEKRGPDGRIQPFKDKFPHGLKALADYVHSKGLKFGVYSDTGNHTCEGYPGSFGYEQLDAQTYAEWGVDYLKYDYCGMEHTKVSAQASYEVMRDALNATGRPILYSLCSWGSGEPHKWGQQVGNSWRTGIDLFAAWDVEQAKALSLPSFLQPVSTAIKQQEAYADFAGPGGFNDPDMLVVGLEGMYPYGIVQVCPKHVAGCEPGMYISRDRWGRVGGLTTTEQRTHFAFWCMLAAPLILGNDPRHMTRATLDILLASEIVALNQDPLGKQARKTWAEDGLEVWVKSLADGRQAALLFNSGSQARDIALVYSRDMKDVAAKWARDVEAAEDCKDKDAACPSWAEKGECQKNAGFMLDRCPRSCPAGCPHPVDLPGPRATAVVRDAWQQEDLGAFTARWNAHLVEPHAARVVVLTFMEPAAATAQDERVKLAQALGLASRQQGRGAGAMPLKLGSGDASKRAEGADGRKLVAGAKKDAMSSADGGGVAVDAAAQEEEIQVLREELARAQAAMKQAEAELAKKKGSGQPVRNPDQVVQQMLTSQVVLGSWPGRVLLACNALLVAALVLVVRRAARHARLAKQAGGKAT